MKRGGILAESTKVRTRKSDGTKNALLRATADLIVERGLDGFTLSEVSRRAGVNRALIYHYFQNRENLIAHAIDDILSRSEDSEPDMSADSVERALRLTIAHPEVSRLFFQLLLNDRPLLRLGERLRGTIEGLDDYGRETGARVPHELEFSIIMLVLAQLSWPLSRKAIADILGITVEEADERFIQSARFNTELALAAIKAQTD